MQVKSYMISSGMVLVTLDTNVVLSGLRSRRGASYHVLRMVHDGRLRPALSVALFLEYEAVLSRPEQVAVTGLAVAEVAEFLKDLAAIGERVTRVPYRWRPILTDPDDDLVVECAVFSGSDYLVTMNERDFKAARGLFRFELVRPGDLIRLLEE